MLGDGLGHDDRFESVLNAREHRREAVAVVGGGDILTGEQPAAVFFDQERRRDVVVRTKFGEPREV